VISFALIYLRLPLSPRRMAGPAAGAALVLAVAVLHAATGPIGDMDRFPPLWVWVGFALSEALMLWTMRDLRHYVGKRRDRKRTPK
jgi:hypothetical protein